MRYAPTDLAVLESHDVVRTIYERRHGGCISAGKASEIASCITQGRQYLAAAADAGDLVSPLLTYYGINALARGAVLFLDIRARIATMKPSHGLGVPSWQEDLAVGLDKLADLKIDVEPSGTFCEFVRVTAGDVITAFPSGPKQIELVVQSSTSVPEKTSVTIKQVVSRIPDIHEIYERVMEEVPNIFAAGVSVRPPDTIELEIFGERYAPNVSTLLHSVPALTCSAPHIKFDSGSRGRPSVTFEVSMPLNDIRLPLRTSAAVNWLVVPFEGALDLAFLPIYYCLSYAAGMLCRYFPQHWLALLRGSRGDRLYPVIREAQRVVARRFPLELADRLLLP